MLHIRDAASLLGVDVMTLRRWDTNGKFPAHRHPISGQRLYARRRIMILREQIENDVHAST